MAELLHESDRGRKPAVVHLVDDRVSGSLCELDGIPERSLTRGEVSHEHKIIVNLLSSEALVAQSNTLIVDQTLLKAKNETLEGEDIVLEQSVHLSLLSMLINVRVLLKQSSS